MKNNIILNTTTFCNYNCSYCDVIKDEKKLSKKDLNNIFSFIENNKDYIWNFKFFGWEPLLSFWDIKKIIDFSFELIWKNYEIVTNGTILNEEIWFYFKKYFSNIFFSIDSENHINYDKIINFIKKYELENKIYFNLIIDPWKEEKSFKQFVKLYNFWFKNFNMLPVYFTKNWEKNNLQNLSLIMKKILDLSLKDTSLKLYWFQKKSWEESQLSYNTFFINIDWNIYFSDIVSTYFWKKLRNNLYLWCIKEFDLKDFENNNFDKQKNEIKLLEKEINTKIKWQKKLKEIMNYFSVYLNNAK